jgi:hypothetical protein
VILAAGLLLQCLRPVEVVDAGHGAVAVSTHQPQEWFPLRWNPALSDGPCVGGAGGDHVKERGVRVGGCGSG